MRSCANSDFLHFENCKNFFLVWFLHANLVLRRLRRSFQRTENHAANNQWSRESSLAKLLLLSWSVEERSRSINFAIIALRRAENFVLIFPWEILAFFIPLPPIGEIFQQTCSKKMSIIPFVLTYANRNCFIVMQLRTFQEEISLKLGNFLTRDYHKIAVT